MTKTNVWVALAAAALVLGACKHEDTAGGTMPAARTTSAAIGELLSVVPGDAAAVGFVDLAQSPWSMITGGFVIPLDDATRKQLDQELRTYVDRYLGLDLSRLQYAVGFVAGPPLQFAVVVKTVEGAPKLPGAEDVEGGKLWRVDPDKRLSLALKAGIVAFGQDAAVRQVLATQAGKGKPVTEANKPLIDWLREQSRGAVLAFAAVKPKALPLPPPIGGIERVAVALGARGATAVVDGDDAVISLIQTQLDKGFAEGLAELERAHAKAIAGQGNPVEGVGAILAAAYAKSFVAQIRPKRTGNRLASSIEFGHVDTSAITLVSGIGILSAVAIPAFMDYMKKSKKTEAHLILNKIGKNAKRWHAEQAMFPKGTVGLTPARSCCGQPTNHCAAAPELFRNNAVWTELDLEIDEPTLFQYSYAGTPDGQGFVARAVGDLDCDGVSITYQLIGTVENGNPVIKLIEPAPSSD